MLEILFSAVVNLDKAAFKSALSAAPNVDGVIALSPVTFNNVVCSIDYHYQCVVVV